MRSSWAPLLDNELVLELGLTYFNVEDVLLVQEEDVLLAQEENLLLAQGEREEWSPKKLKMVGKHFFPELSGDLWGVVCYHHWYPRAGLEGQKKSYLSKKF